MRTTSSVRAAIPRWVYGSMFRARMATLVAADPFDRLQRRMTGRGDLPPLWLRQWVGPLTAFSRAPGEVAAVIALRHLVAPRARVLDIGCGTGVMAVELRRFLEPGGSYLGFDVYEPAITWAQRHFAGDDRFRFTVAEVHTPYSTRFTADASEYSFPAPSDSVDFAISKSVFTHLLEPEARRYLAELARVLDTDGKALLTFFLLRDDGERSLPDATYAFPHGGPDVWHMVAAKPTAAVAYRRAHLEAMAHDAGLVVDEFMDGYWRGSVSGPNSQDIAIVRLA